MLFDMMISDIGGTLEKIYIY